MKMELVKAEGELKIIPFDKVVDILTIITSSEEHSPNAQKVKDSITRIEIDTATFTDHNVTLQDILSFVWSKIVSVEYSKDTQEILKSGLIDTLITFGSTCASGYAANLINVLSPVDEDFRMSWFEQIKSSTKGRILKRIRECKDSEIVDALSMASMPDATELDKETYYTFISCALDEIYTELHSEFVSDGFVKGEDFVEYFTAIKEEWLQYK
jgi:hypothetical protein